MSEIAVSTIVRVLRKTGVYIGEVTEERETHYVVKILAVLKHPMQGDLHNPKQADVPIFHERKALAYREQTVVPKNVVKPYEGEIPEYTASLKEAFDKLKKELEQEDTEFAQKSLRNLEELHKEYERYFYSKQ